MWMQVFCFSRRPARRAASFCALALLGSAVLFVNEHAKAQQNASLAISVKDHRFQPSHLSAAANRPISIRVKNLDAAPMEFESVSLRVEKVIATGSEGIVNVRALAPGRYEFFDDFHQGTRGTLIVQ
jgi:Cupredoxin-like domain